MKQSQPYLMESDDETVRLNVKTNPAALCRQASWCGVKPGLRVLDLGCGAGMTSLLLNEMVQPAGNVIGVDYSAERINYAKQHYGDQAGLEFVLHDFADLTKLRDVIGQFDIIWVRFVLEYYRLESPAIVKDLKQLLKPGGYLCLIDLDYNCLSHYELPPALAEVIPILIAELEEVYNFDAYAGRKLYSYLYDGKYENIEVEMMAHHLIYGDTRNEDAFNWIKKVEVAAARLPGFFTCYAGGYEAFIADFRSFFLDPRRFTYTPLILCKGRRPTCS